MVFRFMAPLVSFPQSLLANLIGSGDLLEFLLITALGADSGGGEGHGGHWSTGRSSYLENLNGAPLLRAWKFKAGLFLRVVYLQKF